MNSEHDITWMKRALALAKLAQHANEVPVGALVIRGGEVLGQGWNCPIGSCDPTAHAEIVALRQAAQQERNYRIPDTTLYVTIEPCSMCLGAIIHARVARVVFGALEPKAGVLVSNPQLSKAGIFNHDFSWSGGVCESDAATLLKGFFSQRRDAKRALKKPI